MCTLRGRLWEISNTLGGQALLLQWMQNCFSDTEPKRAQTVL